MGQLYCALNVKAITKRTLYHASFLFFFTIATALLLGGSLTIELLIRAIRNASLLWLILIGVYVVPDWIRFFRLNSKQRDINWRFLNAGIVIQDATGASLAISWSEVTTAKVKRRGILIRWKPNTLMWFPKHNLSDSDVERLKALVNEKIV